MADTLPFHNYDALSLIEEDVELDDIDDADIIKVLQTYSTEAENARRSGPNPRDQVWEANWDRYWGRYDNSDKASWQSKHVMPEVPQFVDRWAAAMREALDSNADWFAVQDDGGKLEPLMGHIKNVMKALLGSCARTADGHVTDFSSVFEDQMKMGAIMACCAAVTWQDDEYGGWVRVDTVDPRECWYDPKGRNLYRRRRQELDKYQLMAMAREMDEDDEFIYDIDKIMELMGDVDFERRAEKERSGGTGQGDGEPTGRTTITLDEWLCTLIMPDGGVAATDSLVVVANEKFIIRGPESNPFWHDRDWIAFTPMVSVPLSLYGRSYMEDWSDVADAFIELTNLILDGAFTSTLRAFVANPYLLEDPSQLAEGITPNKIFTTDEDLSDVRRFISEIDLGSLPVEAVTVWQKLKDELREGAKLNEIALGQMAPHSRTTATEIQQASQSGSAMIRSMARTIEARFLEPILNMMWKTALQHMDFTRLAGTIGQEAADMFNTRRQEFLDASIHIRVRGISGVVDRQQRLQSLLQALQVIGGNEMLAQSLMRRMDPQKLLDTMMQLFGIDVQDLQLSQEENLIRQLEDAAVAGAPEPQQQQPAPGGGQPQQPGQGQPAGSDLV